MMAFVTRRDFWLRNAVAAAAAALWLTAGATADERRPMSPRVGHNEIVVADEAELRAQIRYCWNVTAMTQREDFNVHVIVELRPDGTVRDASVVGTRFLAIDPYRRSVAQSARGAVMSARCNPLRLPPGSAGKGGRITLTFNPAKIFAW